LKVPEAFLKRHPFPGPGLAVRVLGDVTEGNALDILRQVYDFFYFLCLCMLLVLIDDYPLVFAFENCFSG